MTDHLISAVRTADGLKERQLTLKRVMSGPYSRQVPEYKELLKAYCDKHGVGELDAVLVMVKDAEAHGKETEWASQWLICAAVELIEGDGE